MFEREKEGERMKRLFVYECDMMYVGGFGIFKQMVPMIYDRLFA